MNFKDSLKLKKYNLMFSLIISLPISYLLLKIIVLLKIIKINVYCNQSDDSICNLNLLQTLELYILWIILSIVIYTYIHSKLKNEY